MTFSEVREYQPGDDIRLIDWNVTARTGTPFVKIFEEERELTVFLLVDVSRSGHFGTIDKFKTEIGAEIGAVLGFSAIKNNDKVGVILFSDDVEKYIAPKKGKSHVLRVIRELLYHKPQGKGTSINKALDFLLKVSKRQSVVFLISDFQDDGYWKALRIANRKHDLIGIHLFDQSEVEFPDMGLVKVHDPETEKEVWIDTRSYQERLNYNHTMKERLGKLKKESERIKFDLITVSTTEDYVEPLMSFFKQREKRF
jgi:uncharacterized protein (DUF58 family)